MVTLGVQENLLMYCLGIRNCGSDMKGGKEKSRAKQEVSSPRAILYGFFPPDAKGTLLNPIAMVETTESLQLVGHGVTRLRILILILGVREQVCRHLLSSAHCTDIDGSLRRTRRMKLDMCWQLESFSLPP